MLVLPIAIAGPSRGSVYHVLPQGGPFSSHIQAITRRLEGRHRRPGLSLHQHFVGVIGPRSRGRRGHQRTVLPPWSPPTRRGPCPSVSARLATVGWHSARS